VIAGHSNNNNNSMTGQTNNRYGCIYCTLTAKRQTTKQTDIKTVVTFSVKY